MNSCAFYGSDCRFWVYEEAEEASKRPEATVGGQIMETLAFTTPFKSGADEMNPTLKSKMQSQH